MGKFVLTITNSIGQQRTAFTHIDKTRKEVLESIAETIMEYSTLGFFERMDIRDWLYTTSVMQGKATKARNGITFTLTYERTKVYDTPIAKEHTPYFIPRTDEEIATEYWARKERGMMSPQKD